MKKKDLATIIRKVQSRCCLEDPVKITYYFDDDRDVVFKLHFDSLYVPEKFRVDTENIQNMFTPTNVYDYEDDFRILELNQDEGWIKVKPDCQHFKIVNSYGEADKISLEQKNEEVCLAGKRLNENFAEATGYVLYEANIGNPQNTAELEAAEEAHEEEQNPPTKIDLIVLGITCPVSKTGYTAFQEAVENIGALLPTFDKEHAVKVAVTIPYIDGNVQPSYAWTSVKCFAEEVQKRYGETYAYVAGCGNANFAAMIDAAEIESVTYLTTSAKQGIKDNNYPKILAAKEKDPGKLLVTDSSNADAKKITDIVMKQLKDLKTDKGDVSQKRLSYYEKVKNQTDVKNILTVYKDYFSRSDFENLKAQGQAWKEAVIDVIRMKTNTEALKNLSSLQKLGVTLEGAVKAGALDALGNAEGAAFNRTAEHGDNKVSSSMFSGMQYAGGKSAASTSKEIKVEPKEDKKVKKTTYTDYEIRLLTDITGTGLSSSAKSLKEILADFDFGINPSEDKEKEQKDAEKEDDKKKKDDENKNDKDSQKDGSQEGDSADKDDNSSDDKGTDDAESQKESVKGDVYRRLQEIFKV